MYDFDEIKNADPEIAEVITAEMKRQNSHIELISMIPKWATPSKQSMTVSAETSS